ncbi:MAG: nicotinate phosphoribosyltransferase [Cyanobacteria bacterium REEB67]|nr:nicotinate phosphoribosyltransferase [Cyanobacteria bacterium REEB67]
MSETQALVPLAPAELPPSALYSQSLASLTDLYQLTMAGAYFESKTMHRDAVFHLYFRNNPFKGGFAIACGLAAAVDVIQNFSFSGADLKFIEALNGNDGKPIFSKEFLFYLSELKLEVDIDAVREGEVVFANQPLVRVQGPIIHCQLLETILLNIFNFQTLIATKAARIKLAAEQKPVLEFGLRRAQGFDGGLSASRAAYVGGCDATSNLLAGRLYGIPVKGTHAHSWVMSFDDELTAFEQYAHVLPNNCIFLVDTYDTLGGVAHAIKVGKWLREKGHKLDGIRLDSGDLAYLSCAARKMLDEHGFEDAKIYASNDLDETVISSLIDQGAAIDVWGVGTNLVTAADQPALGGVYKLAAIREPGGEWRPKLKLSEQVAKISTPGIQQVRRFYLNAPAHDSAGSEPSFLADMIFDQQSKPREAMIVDPSDYTRRKIIPPQAQYEDLLLPVFRAGKKVMQLPDLEAVRAFRARRLAGFHPSIFRLLNPHQYPVGLEVGLNKAKMELILKERGLPDD